MLLAFSLGACGEPKTVAQGQEVVQKAIERLEEAKGFRFDAIVTLTGGPRPAEAKIQGEVVSLGDEGVPDVYAVLVNAGQRVELLRRSGRIWVMAADGPWKAVATVPEQLENVATLGPASVLKKLGNLSAKKIDRGWLVSGTSSPQVVGIRGAGGRVKVLVRLDSQFGLQEFKVPLVSVRPEGQPAKLQLEATTKFSDLGAELNLPAPPPVPDELLR
ncbi:MAG: hypothetical protein ACR2M4_10785 [Actinomycetota bacterium]